MPQNSTTSAVRTVWVSKRIPHPPPAVTLDEAIKLCDPSSPLDPEHDEKLIQDLNPQRGGDRLLRVIRNIQRSGGMSTLHYISGHIGSGKTTELLRMKRRLETDPKSADASIFFLDADLMLDRFDVDLEDILVALWGAVEQRAGEATRKILAEVWKEQIAASLKDAQISLPDKLGEVLGKLLGDIKLPTSDWKKKLRANLTPLVHVLILGLNKAFHAMNQQAAEDLRTNGMPAEEPSGVIFLIDNLEKMSQGNRERVNHLFIERMGALRQLNAHLVVTVPLYLCQSTEGANLGRSHGAETIVLPMCKVRSRQADGGTDHEAGLEAMISLMQKRINFSVLFGEERGDVVARTVARYSGGCIRDALRLLNLAINEHDEPPVTMDSIERAAATIRGDYERGLPEKYVPVLKEIARINRFPESCDDNTKQELLRNLYVLEYQNGDPLPWYGVHPLVEQCSKYKLYPPRAPQGPGV